MKNSLILVAIGFVLGIIISFTVNHCLVSDDLNPVHQTIVPVSKIQVKLENEDQKFAIAFDSLSKRNEALVSEVKSSKVLLEKAKKKNTVLQTQIYDLIDRNTVDTTERLADCDSLETRVEDLMILNDYKDSVNSALTISLEDQIRNKNSTIDLATKQNQSLRLILDQSFKDQDVLQGQNKQLSKILKKQKTGNKVLKAFLFIVSGIAVNQLIHR